jgi:glycine/D-amino acid oxidase-like deaminating enzyme
MSCAANTGKTVAELICGERPEIDVAPFDPKRFS